MKSSNLVRACASLLLTSACMSGSTQTYTIPAQVHGDSARVDAVHSFPSTGEGFDNPERYRSVSPSTAEMRSWNNQVAWTTSSANQSCFAIEMHEGWENVYQGGPTSNSTIDPIDFKKLGYKLTTSSGQKVKQLAPTGEAQDSAVTYEELMGDPPMWVPVTSQFRHSKFEVCFETERPLRDEKWVTLSYKGNNGHLGAYAPPPVLAFRFEIGRK